MSDLRLADIAPEPGHRPLRRGPGCIPALVVLLLIIGLGAFAYVKGVSLLKNVLSGPADYNTSGSGHVTIQVADGDVASQIAAVLASADVVKSADAFVDAASKDPRSRSIQAGCYDMRLKMSARSALDRMLSPSSHIDCPGSAEVTIPEGLRAYEILERFEQQTNLTKPDLEKALANTSGLGLPSYADGSIEGYLFPATYPVTKQSTAQQVLASMVSKFNAEADSIHLTDQAKALGVSPHDVVIVASLVQAEGSRPVDLPKIASVIYNRLRLGMPLQLDSTLHYAIDSRGVVQTTPHLRDLNSPYNTYKRVGLPPTAIDSPGETALQAALHPADTNYRYFVTVNLRTGRTLFAATFAQHLKNIAIYRTYCQTSNAC